MKIEEMSILDVSNSITGKFQLDDSGTAKYSLYVSDTGEVSGTPIEDPLVVITEEEFEDVESETYRKPSFDVCKSLSNILDIVFIKHFEKISDMSGRHLRAFLGIESICDCDLVKFDSWDNAHMGHDIYGAVNSRKYLIEAFTRLAFIGADGKTNPEDIFLFGRIIDDEDRDAIADELIDLDTYSCIDVDVTYPEDYDGIDGYVYAAQIEFARNLRGSYATEEEILACFN